MATLVSFSGVDVPQDVQSRIMQLLADYDPDIYERELSAGDAY